MYMAFSVLCIFSRKHIYKAGFLNQQFIYSYVRMHSHKIDLKLTVCVVTT